MADMTLRELCEKTGVSRRVIQGYEAYGLVSPTGHNKYKHNLYDEYVQENVSQIRLYQKIGFSLREIQGIVNADKRTKIELLKGKIDELELKSAEVDLLIAQVKLMITTLEKETE